MITPEEFAAEIAVDKHAAKDIAQRVAARDVEHAREVAALRKRLEEATVLLRDYDVGNPTWHDGRYVFLHGHDKDIKR